jgi:transcriptional regulator of nitric oxide reductase
VFYNLYTGIGLIYYKNKHLLGKTNVHSKESADANISSGNHSFCGCGYFRGGAISGTHLTGTICPEKPY